ncbi:hypothetical protein ACFLXG_03060 [Chloroflexota bacterium]
MNCILKNKINHSNIKEKFKDTLFFCPLFDKKSIGMNQLGIICGACCIRLQMLGDVLAEMIMKKAITYEELERDPECFYQYLSEELTNYGEEVCVLSGKSWEEIRGICNRCNPVPLEPQETPKAPATKMSNIAQREA